MMADTKHTGFIIAITDKIPFYNKLLKSNIENFKVETWIPQKELFALPKTALFINQGGTNSVLEALYLGAVPQLCLGLQTE